MCVFCFQLDLNVLYNGKQNRSTLPCCPYAPHPNVLNPDASNSHFAVTVELAVNLHSTDMQWLQHVADPNF